MRIVTPSRYYLWILPIALLAVAGLVWNRPKPVSAKKGFDLDDVRGRYVSSEIFYDTSSVHAFASPNGSLVGGPIYVASAEVLQADGKGNVCGAVDGFYAFPGPGSNTGPSLFHGQYTVDYNGRVAITTCSDATIVGICQDNSVCPPSAEGNSTRLQVGYIQGEDGNEMVTVSQFLSGFPDSTGFVAHTRTWTKASRDREEHDREHRD
jgi:hypothetical protein